MTERMIKRPKKSDPLKIFVLWYFNSDKYLKLNGKTQYDYASQLDKVCETVLVDGKSLGAMRMSSISIRHIREAYAIWLKSGTRTANYRAACLSVVYRVAMQDEILSMSPVSLLDRQKEQKRKSIWTQDIVNKFLQTCSTDFEYRSIGLIVHMAYEWAQRIGDMRTLTWDSINLDDRRVDLTQSKRGAEVHLPISDSLYRNLVQQKEDSINEYVAPRVKPRGNAYPPYTPDEIGRLINKVKDKANIKEDLWGMDLRRTAITEMVESGVDLAQIMQVSGHQNPQSVTPYLVNTFSGATHALGQRNKFKEDKDE